MRSLLIDERDQKFVLHEMLNIGQLCETSCYGHLTSEMIDASLQAALELAEKESYPIMAKADHEGCRLEDGEVRVPRCYHRLKKHYDQAELASAYLPRQMGGHGLPMSLWTPLFEDFVHNLGFVWPWASPLSITGSIAMIGTEEQKQKYLPDLVAGRWGSAIAFTEEQAGVDDIARQTASAVRQPDGSYRIHGTKPTVTCGDSDLFENMVLCVLARIEGAPADAGGLSLFIVPKYLVNADGSLGARNDYTITGVEKKLGLHGSPTVALSFGENGNCQAELLGRLFAHPGLYPPTDPWRAPFRAPKSGCQTGRHHQPALRTAAPVVDEIACGGDARPGVLRWSLPGQGRRADGGRGKGEMVRNQ
jgi:alkylation response protein AidB-like acyl-CoA dehydrogenase